MELSADAFSLHSGVMELGYQAEMHLPGGQNFKVPLVSTPLPHAPLNGSPMNMLLSGNLLNVLLLALVPPQAFTVPKKELNRWSQAGAFRFVIPQASNAQMMQIAHRVLLLLIEPGKVQVQQNIEMRLYGDHPRGAYQVLLAIRASVNSVAGVSADNGRLKLTLGLQGISNISVIRSSIRNVDAEHLTGIIRQLVSTLLLPRQNQLLAEGMPLPLVGNLGVHHLGVAPGHNVLKLFIPPSLRSAQAPVAV
ncbi:bactericidal permeability-increasing protein-like [Hemicordylus capensis]|uniref:bactericidal permeability-increasing protein-like n=1 Tax=Hemicordylus capensis TaxID=884348 RepID=UPI002303880A|nr:bactericidal permeability-increasing protein-like [Hemicordylus capensis]